MEFVTLLFMIGMYTFTHDSVHGSKIQCGECQCIEIRQNFILDCENLGMTYIPDVDDLIRRHISHAYMSGNNLQIFDIDAFDKWYSLKFIDLTGNPGLECSELTKIPPNVKIQVECMQQTKGMYFRIFL